MRPNLYVEVEATLYMDLQEADELRSLFQVYVIYVDVNSSCCNEHFWHEYPIRVGNNRILLNPFAVPQKWQLPSNHRKCSNDMSCSSRRWELTSYFPMFPVCGWHRQQGFKAASCPYAATLLFG
jgi:hypothetical protein